VKIRDIVVARGEMFPHNGRSDQANVSELETSRLVAAV